LENTPGPADDRYSGQGEDEKGDPEWQDRLIRTRDRRPRPVVANAITAFRHAPEWAGRLWYDAFRERTILCAQPPWMSTIVPHDWGGEDDTRAAAWLQHAEIAVSPAMAAQAVDVVARDHRYHPVLNYLSRCRWDEKPRLDTWAIRYLGAEDTPYVRAVAARWLISAVARVHEPGCKADCVLILEGRQGLGKSTALKTLAQPWFSDEIATLGTKDAAMQVAGVWVVEMAELDSMSRGDIGKVKAFVSRTTDRFRPPYGHRVVQQPRQSVFAGSVNHTDYLRDETGARRFWPLWCTNIDLTALGNDRDQLWAEAMRRYRRGTCWWLDTPELTALAEEVQRGRYQADAWQALIEKYIADKMAVAVPEVLNQALQLPLQRWGQSEQNRVAGCLKAAGWRRKQVRIPGDREWRYFRPAAGD
jgi:predicted P-loop ATPase